MKELKKYLNKIRILCKQYNVKSLYLFGSMATDSFNDDSDIDLVVDLLDTDPFKYSEHYFALKTDLKLLLKRHIDLLEQKAVRNPYLLQQIENTKVEIYAK